MAKIRPKAEAAVCRRVDNEPIDEIVTINVAGEKYQTLESTLKRFPNSVTKLIICVSREILKW